MLKEFLCLAAFASVSLALDSECPGCTLNVGSSNTTYPSPAHPGCQSDVTLELWSLGSDGGHGRCSPDVDPNGGVSCIPTAECGLGYRIGSTASGSACAAIDLPSFAWDYQGPTGAGAGAAGALKINATIAGEFAMPCGSETSLSVLFNGKSMYQGASCSACE